VSDAIREAEAILRAACGDRVRTGYPLAPLTTFRIGGRAALYLEPESEGDLAAVSSAIKQADVPWFVLGKGSNVLVSDDGFRGIVLRLGRGFRWAGRDGTQLTAGGAMPLPALSSVALHHGLTGLEFGIAIPATVGGAIRMNAGAHGGEMARIVERLHVYRLAEARPGTIGASDAGFAYRRSDLPPDAVITGAIVSLDPGDPGTIRTGMDEAREWRRATQPIAEPNCGSVFTNPPGDHAARLIEAAGAKGLAVGAARVSEKHANFIVAGPGATASDVAGLIDAVRELVERVSGVRLEVEVHLVGRFDRVRR
jgi:UDP-N-acetylmuramate dehydrogenase